MAESGSGQEKTEEPSSRKLQQARSKGQVPRSRELNTVIMLLVAGVGLLLVGQSMVARLADVLRSNFVMERQILFDPGVMATRLWDSIQESLLTISPLLGMLLIAAVVSPLLLSGWNFSNDALIPKLERMDPIKGLGRIFGWKGLVELLKSLAKFVIVASVGYLLLQTKLESFLGLGQQPVNQGLAQAGEELIWVFILLSSTLIVVALVDVPFQMWDYKRQQKMTRQELKDEHKETEGNPELKSKQRSVQREISMRRMMDMVPQADVVITNPTHFSVALKYDALNMAAPVVVALGADLVALQIRRVATANDVPILESPVLARALFYHSEINEEIPAGLYLAVAQVLAYIYQLRQHQEKGANKPNALDDLPIPDEFRTD
ncbi:MAG: flagellar biosynthesis protein FlhB [Gammaproteobacteria bacterium]|nr:flagellar biosynthesis protein FlhB [Gammaproteobacteria bacterium]MDH5802643.1 flagellar biosynthesis protein FlhB [Gammaproteobacteria bacterium]